MDLHFASVWEAISDEIPNRDALVCGDVRRTWREYDDRAARIARFLQSRGLRPDGKAAVYLHNSNEYLEAQYGIFKARGVPVNVNYRYKFDELVYLLDNADAEVVFFQACYAARIWEIRNRLPRVTTYIQVDDGTEALLPDVFDYEQVIRGNPPLDRMERSGDDIYMLYTGGTTGMPKGVMYHHHPFVFGLTAFLLGSRNAAPKQVEDVPAVIRELSERGNQPISLTACPLMHGTGMWLGAMMPLLGGGTIVTISKLGLDPHLIWGEIERNRCTTVTIVGDAFARPMLDALNDAGARSNPYDISSLKQIVSSGVMWSAEVKERLLEYQDMSLLDTMGSTEGGLATSVSTRDNPVETARFRINSGVRVFTEDGRDVEPGSGEVGMLASGRTAAFGYYKDPEKSAETFREIDGIWYSFAGDWATVEADGSITLLGRGSNCINTAGEKVYPEEVEEALKRHAEVYDCLVVGIDDERFGQRVVAVTSARNPISEQDLIDFAHGHLAGYKSPKRIVFVDEVRRAPNGKADYKWARSEAERALS
ncbi:MAG: acyl-CoA synthetase [Gammaproteobacteria bacterium]|nr:acyl-CoA synthetase [Gammaproteobacteria bacterium]